MEGPKTLEVTTPAPAASTDEENSAQHAHAPRVGDDLAAVLFIQPTVHNWIELVYEAFSCNLPTTPNHIALLGLRGATLSAPMKGGKGNAKGAATSPSPAEVAKLEEAIETSNVDVTRGAAVLSTSSYGDLLFLAKTPTTPDQTQCVDVFECLISVTPENGPPRLPDLIEGKQFFARPASYFGRSDFNDMLEVDTGFDKAALVLAVARAELANWKMSDEGVKYQHAYPAGTGDAWCGMFVSYVMHEAYMTEVRFMNCYTQAYPSFQSFAWGRLILPGSAAEPADVALYQWAGVTWRHTGIVLHDDGVGVTAIEGNTGSPDASQDDGDGLYLKTATHRPKDMVSGYGRPRYKPIIYWGSERGEVHDIPPSGATVLRHHYYVEDARRLIAETPAATLHRDETSRYHRFIYNAKHAPNSKQIPYLIVSTKYVLTYTEWVKYVAKMGGSLANLPNRSSSVLRATGLKPPGGIHGRYLPSYMTEESRKKKVDAVMAHYGVAPPGESAAAKATRLAARKDALERINDAMVQPKYLPPSPQKT